MHGESQSVSDKAADQEQGPAVAREVLLAEQTVPREGLVFPLPLLLLQDAALVCRDWRDDTSDQSNHTRRLCCRAVRRARSSAWVSSSR